MPLYGFPIKTKTNSGPKIKYFTAAMADNSAAQALSIWLAENGLANFAKADVNQRLVIHGEHDYEIPEDANLIDELWITVQLLHETNGVQDGQGFLSIPCLRPSEGEAVCSHLVGLVQVQCTDGTFKPCTSAKIVKSTTYAI